MMTLFFFQTRGVSGLTSHRLRFFREPVFNRVRFPIDGVKHLAFVSSDTPDSRLNREKGSPQSQFTPPPTPHLPPFSFPIAALEVPNLNVDEVCELARSFFRPMIRPTRPP